MMHRRRWSGTPSGREGHKQTTRRGWSAGHPLLSNVGWLWLLMVAALVSGCTGSSFRGTPRIAKIGLIAPFEGLYRESGYAALDALRAALADCAPPDVGVVPVALDDSAAPDKAVRAAQKLLVDPAVVAVVGPFTPATVAAAHSVLGESPRPWIAPLTVDPSGGFAPPQSSEWLAELLQAAQPNQARGRILMVDLPEEMADDWLVETGSVQLVEWSGSTLLAGEVIADEGMAGDSVLWLGDAAQGAAWLKRQHTAGRFPAFWLVNPVGGDILAAHLAADSSGTPDSPMARWLVWSLSDYNGLLAPHTPDLPIAQLTYMATCTALDQAFGVTNTPSRTSSLSWEVQHRDLGAAFEPTP